MFNNKAIIFKNMNNTETCKKSIKIVTYRVTLATLPKVPRNMANVTTLRNMALL